MRLALPLVLLVLLAALVGCGGSADGITSSDEATFSGPVPIQSGWEHTRSCKRPPGASRWGCTVGSFRCQSVVSDRGWSTSCSKPGRSVSFTVRP